MSNYLRREKLKRIKYIDIIFPAASLLFLLSDSFYPHHLYDRSLFKRNYLYEDIPVIRRFLHQQVTVNYLDDASQIPSPNFSEFFTISPSVEQGLAMEDLDLIELLWRQDIDLGVTRESFDNKSKIDSIQNDIFQIKGMEEESILSNSILSVDNETGELMQTNGKPGYSGVVMEEERCRKVEGSEIDYSAEKRAIISHWMNVDGGSSLLLDELDDLYNQSTLLSPSSLIGNISTDQSCFIGNISTDQPCLTNFDQTLQQNLYDLDQWQYFGDNGRLNDNYVTVEANSFPCDEGNQLTCNILMEPLDSMEESILTMDSVSYLNFEKSVHGFEDEISLVDSCNQLDDKSFDDISLDSLITLDNATLQQLLDDHQPKHFNLSCFDETGEGASAAVENERHKRGGRHNHTYATSIGRPTKKQLLQMKLQQKELDAKRGVDKRRATELGLDFDKIIESSVETFAAMCDADRFNEQEIQLIKDIRRRGKNKLAAQNCRKRKFDELASLEDANEEMRREVEHLRTQHQQLTEEKQTYTLTNDYLKSKVFRALRDDEGKPYDPRFFQLKQSADGEHLFLTNLTTTSLNK